MGADLIDSWLALDRHSGGGAWSDRSRSTPLSHGPLDGRPNPEGARVSHGRGQNSVHRPCAEVAQPPAARWPSGTVRFHAGLRMARRTGRPPAPRSGFHIAVEAPATCAFVGRGSRGTPSQSAESLFGGGGYSGFGGVGNSADKRSLLGSCRFPLHPTPLPSVAPLRVGHPPWFSGDRRCRWSPSVAPLASRHASVDRAAVSARPATHFPEGPVNVRPTVSRRRAQSAVVTW